MVGFPGPERQSAEIQRRRVRARVSGAVQGVFYRQSARRIAASLGLSGWIRNRPDGKVELAAEGESASVERFIEWCRRGPAMAEVESVETIEEAPQGRLDGFSILN